MKHTGSCHCGSIKFEIDSDLEKIASIKIDDLNANSIDQAKEMIRGSARSMGIEVKG